MTTPAPVPALAPPDGTAAADPADSHDGTRADVAKDVVVIEDWTDDDDDDNQPAPPPAIPGGDFPCDDVMALRLGQRLRLCARYVAAERRWMVFDGARWVPDDVLWVHGQAREVARHAVASASLPLALRARMRSAAVIARMERLARSDPALAAAPGQWDPDPWRLNTPTGTIDLRTGALRPHDREDWCTRITAVAPGGDCPRFLAFLERIFAGDADLIRFVQRALGYALTGAAADHALFFCFGTGGNGKSVLLNTVAHVLGSYAAVAPAELLAAAPPARQAGDLAFLRGARFVMAPEMERGRRWNEALLKSLTGGDRITARDARGSLATWRPCFKLFVAGNHAPELGGVDPAIRRRFNLVPFGVTIGDPDPMLLRRLVEEWPGILAWMIEGCRAWQAEGLRPPPAVTAATGAYLATQDTFGAWLDEAVCVAEGATAATADLYASWSAYAAAAQEEPGSKKAFAQALQARGFALCRIGHAGARGFSGLCLPLRTQDVTPGNPSASVGTGWGAAGSA